MRTPEQERRAQYKAIIVCAVIAVAIGVFVVLAGCQKGLFQVGSTTRPAAEVNVTASAPALPEKLVNVEKGAIPVNVKIEMPVTNEMDLGRLSILAGVIVGLVLIGVLLLFKKPPGFTNA